MYSALNYFFFVFHTALILFNTFGWIWRKTRKWNLFTLSLTFLSWFGLGIWHGWGYCVFTDWHWEVRRHLGFHDMSNSYNQFLVKKLFGIDLSVPLVNTVTVVVFFLSFALSIALNVRYARSGPKKA